MIDLHTRPFNLPELEDSVYSNFDHQLDEAVAQKLKAGDCMARHVGWEFCANIWFDDGQWHSYIMQYHSHRETKSNADLRELIRETNDSYGDE